jgi:hypothetical protein
MKEGVKGGRERTVRLPSLSRLLLVFEAGLLCRGERQKGCKKGGREITYLVSASAKLHKVDASSVKLLADVLGLLSGHATVGKVRGVEFNGEEEVGGNLLLDLVEDLKEESRAVLDAATVVVGTTVGTGAEEL